ncbi:MULTISPECIES: type IV secretory system conjugative DNA transfer family protein [Thalassospira]|uniref:Conjugal transfer protein TraG n=2 Tax=Thalassospira TaxID=168934 RepID=A0A367WAT5_9PROT|nr:MULTISPECIES: type IV secretory system conjugative DNA transfer family protein [Thalassospira]MDG4720051.1 type IV secretory system conjugative DNA transfer family protein [Thalassospira sp. FZY0004]RCK38487.1 conjugal transfer protein TraG [Thalassospira profundimaris]
MGAGLFRVIMVLLWALGGMIIALGLFNGDYELALLGGVCFIIPMFLPLVMLAVNRASSPSSKSKPKMTPAQAAKLKAEGQWAKREDLTGRKLLEGNPPLVLGRWGEDKRLVGASGLKRIITFASKPGDYYRSSAEPNALIHTGNLFVYESFGNIYRAVHDRRSKMGQKLIVLDPHGQSGAQTDQFNPFDFIRQHGEGQITDTGLIADTLLAPMFVQELDEQEVRIARTLLQGFIVYTIQKSLKENRNLAEVRRNLIMPSHRFYKILEELMGIDSVDGRISDVALNILDMTEDQRMKIIEACRNATAEFDHPQISRLISSSSFTIDDVVSGGVSIFVIGQLGGETPDVQPSFSRVMLAGIMNMINQRAWKSGDPEFLVLMDGVERVGRMPLFERLLGGGYGDGMIVWPGFSGVSGLMDVCLNWENVVGRVDALCVFGQEGAFNLDWVSGLTAMSRFDDTGGGSDTTRPVHLRPQDNQPILRSAEVARFPKEEQILFRKGCPPIRGWRLDWHHDEMFSGLAVHAPTFNSDE